MRVSLCMYFCTFVSHRISNDLSLCERQWSFSPTPYHTMSTTAAFSALNAVLCVTTSPLMSPFNARGQGDWRWQAIVSRIHSSLQRGSSSEGCHPRWGLLVALPQSPAITADPLKRPSRKLRENGCDGFTSSIQRAKVINMANGLQPEGL